MCGAADTVAVCPCYQPRQDVFWMWTGRTAQKDYFMMQQRVFFCQDKYIYNELL